MAKLNPGDRVAYAAKFLRSMGQFTGRAPERRGTYLGPEPTAPKTHARVRWDNIEEIIAGGRGDYAEADYCEDVRANGSLVALSAIAKVGSARFALNDL